MKCRICKAPANFTCGKCKWAFYCSEKHQSADWKVHKYVCGKLLHFDVLEVTPDTLNRLEREIVPEFQKSNQLKSEEAKKVRFEWISNWLQKFKGQSWYLKTITGQDLDIQFNPPNDWSWNGKMWIDRFVKDERKAYWVTIRDEEDSIVMAITVQYFPEQNISTNMYIAKIDERYPSLFYEMHSFISDFLKIKEIHINPMKHVRDMLLENKKKLNIKQNGGQIIILVDERFMNLWKEAKCLRIL